MSQTVHIYFYEKVQILYQNSTYHTHNDLSMAIYVEIFYLGFCFLVSFYIALVVDGVNDSNAMSRESTVSIPVIKRYGLVRLFTADRLSARCSIICCSAHAIALRCTSLALRPVSEAATIAGEPLLHSNLFFFF